MTAQILKMKHNEFVRFFKHYIVCDDCGQETRGRVYSESQQVVCSKCKGVILDAEIDAEMEDELLIVTYIPEDYDEDDC